MTTTEPDIHADIHTTAGKLADLRRRTEETLHPVGETAVEKVHAKGKLTARERVLAENADVTAVDGAVAGDDAVANRAVLLHVEVGGAVPRQGVEFDEGVIVQQRQDPLPGGQLALGVGLLHGGLADRLGASRSAAGEPDGGLFVAFAALRDDPLAERPASAGVLGGTGFFYRYELPKINAWLRVVETRDMTCANLPEEAF